MEAGLAVRRPAPLRVPLPDSASVSIAAFTDGSSRDPLVSSLGSNTTVLAYGERFFGLGGVVNRSEGAKEPRVKKKKGTRKKEKD